MKTIHVYQTPGKYTLLRGPLHELLKGLGIPALRSPMDRGYQLRSERLPDLLAQMQSLPGWAVRVHGDDQ